MLTSIIFVIFSIIVIWIARLIGNSERAYNDLFSASGIELTTDQMKIGKNMGPMHNVILDRGVKIEMTSGGKFIIHPTAKFASEYWSS